MHALMWLTLSSHVVLYGPDRMGVGRTAKGVMNCAEGERLPGRAFQGEWCWCWPGELNEGLCVCMGGWKELSEREQLRKGSEPGDLVGIRRQKNGRPEFMGLGTLRLYALDDKMLLKIFSVEKDKWISIWNLSKIVGGWGRAKKTVFKIIPSVVFLKGLLASLLGEPHPDSEPLCGGWAVSQHLSRPWCWSETQPCDQERSGAWGRGRGPNVWHPRKSDISSAKIRNQTKSPGGCSHSPYQPRGPPLWLRGEHKATPTVLASELSSAQLLRTLIIPSEHKVIQASQTISPGLLVSGDSRTERWWNTKSKERY